jgi:SAM-dependent methyltransferase
MQKLPHADQANPLIIGLHDDPVEYEHRLVEARYALDKVLGTFVGKYITPADTVLDLGCGSGAVAECLLQNKHTGIRIANDISPPMVQAVLEDELYAEGYLGTAEELTAVMKEKRQKVDWAIALSVFYYFSPEEMGRVLQNLYTVCNKGIILSLDGIPDEFTQYVEKVIEQPLPLYDHRHYFETNPPPTDWTLKTHFEGTGWQNSKTGIQVPVSIVVLNRD